MKLKKISKALVIATGAITGMAGVAYSNSVTSKPFVMAYYPNYAGYFNNNTVSQGLTTAGHPIPEPSYVIPGITVGYPAFDNNSIVIQHQSTDNRHLTDTTEGLSALVYGFFQPQSDGTFRFSDSWADFKNSDLKSDGLCGSQIANSLKICYRDGKPPFSGGGTSDTQCWGNVCYGGFDAFLQLDNKKDSLQHYISIGGWTYRGIMDDLVAQNGQINDENITNFIKTLTYLKGRGLQGVDLDIEFDNSKTGYQKSLLFKALAQKQLVKKIKDIGLDIAITIQANPVMLKGLMDNGWLSAWFSQGLDHLSLMTYDFHGAFDGVGNATGFHSSLFALPDSPYGKNEFSVNKAIEALSGLSTVDMAKVNIGIPAYARAALTNISSDNHGLFQKITDKTTIVPGDLDATYCETSLTPTDPNKQCSGTFSYIYILKNMLSPNGPFTTTDWQYTDPDSGKTYYVGSTLYAKSWKATASKVIYDGDNPTAIEPSTNNQKTYSDVFMAYISPKDAYSYGEYAKLKGLGGAIVWTVNSDDNYQNQSTSLIYNFEQGYKGTTPVKKPEIQWNSKGAPASANLTGGQFTADAKLINAPDGDALNYTCKDQTTTSASCQIESQGKFSLSGAKDQDQIIVTAEDSMKKADAVDSDPITVKADKPKTPDIQWNSKGAPASANLTGGQFTADAKLINAPDGDTLNYTCKDQTTASASCEIQGQGKFSLSGAKDQDQIIVTAEDSMKKADAVDSDPITVKADKPSGKVDVTLYGTIQYYQVYGPGTIQSRNWYTNYSLGELDLSKNPVRLNPWNAGFDISQAITCPLPTGDEKNIIYQIQGDANHITCTIKQGGSSAQKNYVTPTYPDQNDQVKAWESGVQYGQWNKGNLKSRVKYDGQEWVCCSWINDTTKNPEETYKTQGWKIWEKFDPSKNVCNT
ncbi:glycosyl hydrolase family 18 protein [Facilibium subflavum]|uniref:glycosyl hydrolase family 18 protein n=1 Tax=Facilibium subflavum TaxID=2219058 RepID=UPI0013C33B8D|nr:glycoside hydrolase family 18 protein [Facilibium subflavum]